MSTRIQKLYDERKAAIESLYHQLTRYSQSPTLYYKIHPVIGNVEYIVSPDIGLDQADPKLQSQIDTPQEMALQFLQKFENIFIPRTNTFRYRLYLKHTLHSQMGTHCIFGYRYQDHEVSEVSFVVHLDREQHIVMITSVYDPEALTKMSRQTEPERPVPTRARWSRSFNDVIKWLAQQYELTGQITTDILWIPDQHNDYQPRLEVKANTRDYDMVFYFDQHFDPSQPKETVQSYRLHVGAAARKTIIATVYDDFWEPVRKKRERLEKVLFNRVTKKVVLRDLQLSKGGLMGRYVTIRDNIMDFWPDLDFVEPPQPETSSSVFDRVMAYYHLDLVQRYFRELGMLVLDEYEQFNPMHVVLGGSSSTRYVPTQNEIHLARLAHPQNDPNDPYRATDAREARLIYHEFVHAITDALCRLRRNDLSKAGGNGQESPRLGQVYQAAALDEGLADYFACSLAARQGATRPYFYIPVRDSRDPKKLNWRDNIRKLGGRSISTPRKYRLPRYSKRVTLNEQTIYRWSEEWSRYLWMLRCELEPEVADTVIAHSIFFLTRWSTFGMGMLAILLADHLLFSRTHEQVIMQPKEPGLKNIRDWEMLGQSAPAPMRE